MEGLLTSSSSGSDIGGNKSDCSIGLGDGNKNGTGRQFWEQSVSKSSSPNYKISRLTEEGEYESAKREMTQVREENARLKKMLEQVERDYRSLHSRLIGIKQQQQQQSTKSVINSSPSKNNPQSKDTNFEEPELVSLSLGRSPRSTKRDDQSIKTKQNLQQLDKDRGLKLGLDFDLEGSTSKSEDSSELETAAKEVEEQAGEISPCPPSKLLKTMTRTGEDEASPQREVKRARVSVRARCDSATMNDGCQWRKYGQKIAKGNPCPRAYYRCTVAPSCPVRKQVQRCVEDMSILITTYEGTHNHPLPVSATAMASTTSAAASMVLSGSSTSATNAATSPTNFHGLNFNLTHNPSTTPFYIPNASSQAFSTITLDLTTSTPTPHFNMFSPRFPSTNMGLSSSETNTLPHTWGNGYPNYGTLPLNKTTNGSLNSSQFYQSYTEKNSHVSSSQQILTETLTKAITSDPSLRSVINAAISSMVSDGGENGVNGCASSYLSRSLSSISQPGNLMHIQQAPLPFSISKKNSMSAADDRDQIN